MVKYLKGDWFIVLLQQLQHKTLYHYQSFTAYILKYINMKFKCIIHILLCIPYISE